MIDRSENMENILEYERHGFFIIKGLFSIEELQPLINEVVKFSSAEMATKLDLD